MTTMCRTCAGFYVYRGRRFENNDIFQKCVHVGLHQPAGWLQQRKACALLLIAQALQQRGPLQWRHRRIVINQAVAVQRAATACFSYPLALVLSNNTCVLAARVTKQRINKCILSTTSTSLLCGIITLFFSWNVYECSEVTKMLTANRYSIERMEWAKWAMRWPCNARCKMPVGRSGTTSCWW